MLVCIVYVIGFVFVWKGFFVNELVGVWLFKEGIFIVVFDVKVIRLLSMFVYLFMYN